MFEKTSRLAEKLATSVSRRGFLGSAGRWAGATALAIAGVLTTAGSAQADNGKTACYCCNVDGFCTLNDCVGGSQTCPSCPPGYQLLTRAVKNCAQAQHGCKAPCGGA